MTIAPLNPTLAPLGCTSIEVLAQGLFEELSLSGYSILLDDVKKVVIDSVTSYAGWTPLDVQYKRTTAITIDDSLPLIPDEWVIILPLCRAHCDVLQARLAEAARSMGVEMFGLSVSEANQIFNQRTDELPRLAFACGPWTVGEE